MRRTIRWPDGDICPACYKQATRTRGRYPGCGIDRLLPGRDGEGRQLCVDCAGIASSFICTRCGIEDERWAAGLCVRCSWHDRLRQVLDDGTGRIAPALQSLYEGPATMPRAVAGLWWPREKKPWGLLTTLARHPGPLTHEVVDALPPSAARTHLRDLLTQHGVLPARNRFLAEFEHWAASRLAVIEVPADRRTISTYVRWHQLPRLRAKDARGELTANVTVRGRAQITTAISLLAWLRRRDLHLRDCRQEHIDRWCATTTRRVHSRDFLTWAMDRRLVSPLRLPRRRYTAIAPLSQQQRIGLIARLFRDKELDLRDRVAGLLLLLYAQPLPRIARLTTSRVRIRAGRVTIDLAGIDLPAPPPLDELILELVRQAQKPTNAEKGWLFPSRAGQPLTPRWLGWRLHRLGISRAGRLSGLDQLVREVPAPILAQQLGYNPRYLTDRALTTASDWQQYAAIRAGLAQSHAAPGEG
ncbi:MAG: hypothetical protein M3O70_01435 [Actinomycetota bacterium]|nr:hypothetical protein [Actinomycetota bacterium]